jgi:hypothetical protein
MNEFLDSFFLIYASLLKLEMTKFDVIREIRLIRLDLNLIQFDFLKSQTDSTQSEPDPTRD